MRFQAIVFDFDYTLADSSRGIVKCVNDALHDLGFPPAPSEVICRTIGLPLVDVFTKLTGQEYVAQSQDFALIFKSYADEVMADLTVLYPTVNATMRLLRQKEIKLGIVSTKFRYRIESVLQRENVRDWFDVIVGGEDVANHKPNPEGLLQAITSLQCPLAQTIYVGDSVVDAETAKRADISFVAVLSGVTNRNEFENYPVIEIVDNLSQLPERLAL